MKKQLIFVLSLVLLLGSSTAAVASSPSTLQATFAKFKIVVNGKTQTSVSQQIVHKGTTYVPVREIASIFNYSTSFNPNDNKIEFI